MNVIHCHYTKKEYMFNKIMKEKDIEKIVIQGLEYESIEKEKASERKALTRKHGLKPEDAKYVQSTTGQTRDIVAEKLGISGRQWERMRFIYQHRDCILSEEYENWRTGKISTSKLYKELSEDIRYNETVDEMIDILVQMQWNIYSYEGSDAIKDLKQNLMSSLYTCREKTKNEVLVYFDKLIEYNQRILNKHYDDIGMMKVRLLDLKQKLQNRTHNDI